MKKHLMIVAMLSLVALPAFALDLNSARSTGQVMETPDGYIKAVASSPEVKALVSKVNAARRAEYERISKQNGQSVDLVGRLAAPEIAKNAATAQ